MGGFSKIYSIWYPKEDKNSSDIQVQSYRKFIITLSYCYIALNCVYLLSNMQMSISILPPLLQIFGSLFVLVSMRIVTSYMITAHAFMAVTECAILGLIFSFHEFPYTVLIWTPVYVVAGVYLVGIKGGMLWSILGIVGIIFIMKWAPTSGYPSLPIEMKDVPDIAATTIILSMSAAFATSYAFRRYIQRLLDEVWEQNIILKEQKEVIEDAIKEKESLISLVCHDIANPLSIVKWVISDDIPMPPEKRQEKIGRAVKTITEIVESVREVQAVQTNKMMVNLSEVELRSIFEKAMFLFEHRLNEKELDLVFEYDENEDVVVVADEVSLSNSVFNNLISNAIKFSDKGGKIVVKVESSNEQVNISVRDFGIGVPEDLVNNLFRSDVATTRKGTSGEKGTGFGLPLTKLYMEKYGGSISVTSIEKKDDKKEGGTTFTLSFPQKTK